MIVVAGLSLAFLLALMISQARRANQSESQPKAYRLPPLGTNEPERTIYETEPETEWLRRTAGH
jgi:hypothetical protein